MATGIMESSEITATATTPQPVTKPTPAPTPTPNSRGTWLLAGAALSSGWLLWLSFYPVSLGYIFGWFALVPFLLLARAQARPRVLYLCAWLTGLAFFVPTLQWMRVADWRMYFTWIALAGYCSLYMPAALHGIRLLDRRRIPMVVSVPLIWVALEYVRSFLLTGFAWFYLAHTQHHWLSMIQIADLAGVYGVSLVVAAVNGFLFDCLYQQPEIKTWFGQPELEIHRQYASVELLNRGFLQSLAFRRNLILEGMALALLIVGVFTYGVLRMGDAHFTQGPVVCLLQSNLDQRIRNDAAAPENDGRAEHDALEHLSALCFRAAHNHYPKPDLIVWPETSYPAPWFQVSPKFPAERLPAQWRDLEIGIRDRLAGLGSQCLNIPQLIGINSHYLDDHGKHKRYNSAILLNDKGKVTDRFDKMHRVPFGEYVPLKDWIPFMNYLAPYDYDYSVHEGEHFTRFKAGKHTFGVLVCFEDSDPFLARRYLEDSDDGPPVDFLVNISNDGWFDGTYEHEEHLAVSRFRAVECRRTLVRSANMGISAVIDGNGRVLKQVVYPGTEKLPVWVVPDDMVKYPEMPSGDWSKFKQVAGVVKASVPIDRRASLYVVAGDWLPISCWLALLGPAAWGYVRKRRQALV